MAKNNSFQSALEQAQATRAVFIEEAEKQRTALFAKIEEIKGTVQTRIDGVMTEIADLDAALKGLGYKPQSTLAKSVQSAARAGSVRDSIVGFLKTQDPVPFEKDALFAGVNEFRKAQGLEPLSPVSFSATLSNLKGAVLNNPSRAHWQLPANSPLRAEAPSPAPEEQGTEKIAA